MNALIPRKNKRQIAISVCSVLAAAGVYLLLPSSCPEPARRTAFIFVIAALFWAFEVIPLFATSLLVVLLETFLLAQPGSGTIPYTTFLVPLSNPVIILFLGGFVLARAFQKYQIDTWVVSDVLRFFGSRPYWVLLGFMVATAFLGMWISNTATTAVMLAIILPVVHGLGKTDPFKKALILAIPFGARIGGLTTLVGTPTNAIAVGLLEERGIFIHFLSWTLVTLPLAIMLLVITSVLLYRLFPPHRHELAYSIKKPSDFNWKSKIVLLIGGLTVFLWFSAEWHQMPEAVTALFCIALLTALRLFDTDDIKQINWDILLLMWGGLALGEGMEQSGLAAWITTQPIFPPSGWQLNLVVCFIAVFLSTFISNTATVNLLIPIVLTIPSANPTILAAIVALGASLDVALPTATPPMAMAYATKEISIADMLKAGIMFAVGANALLLLGVETMMKKVFVP